MEYNVQNLEYAVNVFYNSENAERQQAHEWLANAQRCPEAWTFVWELLKPEKSTEVQFFAATTLHTKILRFWNEVPAENHEQLKDQLTRTLSLYADGPKIVLNRLCISYAAFIMQQSSNDLLSLLTPINTNTSLVLEILTVIPVEFNSMTMGTAMRAKNRKLLHEECPKVLDEMENRLGEYLGMLDYTSINDGRLAEWTSLVACSASWLKLGGEYAGTNGAITLPDCSGLCRNLIRMVQFMFFQFGNINGAPLDACEAALEAIRAAAASPDSANYPNSAADIIIEMSTVLNAVLPRCHSRNNINEEFVCQLVTCAVAIGQCHSRVIVTSVIQEPDSGMLPLMQAMLQAQNGPGYYPLHETRSQLLFGFWYTLQDEIPFVTNKGIGLWTKIFKDLLVILIKKSRVPPDELMSRNDAEVFRCYRQDVADCVMYCLGVLETECWSVILNSWHSAKKDDEREAVLHALLALADATVPVSVAEKTLNMLREAAKAATSSNSPKLVTTALDCLGAYANWLSLQENEFGSEAEALTRESMQAAGAALQKCPQSAALALKKLCTECTSLAAPLASEIIQAIKDERLSGDAWVRRQLLGAAGAALAASEPEVAAPLLSDLANVLARDLAKEGTEGEVSQGAAEQTAALLIALNVQPGQAADVFRSLLPALPPYALTPALVPSLFQLLRHAVSVLIDDCIPFLDDMGQLIERALSIHPCPSGLELVSLEIIMFDTNWSGCAALFRSSVTSAACSCAADPSANSDVTQALFTLLTTIAKKKKKYLECIEDMLPELLNLACNCIRLWEAGAARAACSWLSQLMEQRPQVVQPKAADITIMTLTCIGGATPRHQVEPLAEVLLALNRAQWAGGAGLSVWLRAALLPPGFPTVHATDSYKESFATRVLREKSSKRRLLESVQEFSLVCRGIVDTEYGKQTLASRMVMS